MFNTSDVRVVPTLSRDFVVDQDLANVLRMLNTAALGFTGDGYGNSAAGSTMFAMTFGGVDDQAAIVTMKYVAPTVAGGEDLGVLLRMLTPHTTAPDRSTFYYARVVAGEVRITRVVNGTFSTLDSSAGFNLAQGTAVTITASVRGSVVTARFEDGISDVTLSAVDTAIPASGVVACRSGPTASTFRVATADLSEAV